MIRVAIVEDDRAYILVLRQYLTDYQDRTGVKMEVAVYGDGDEIVQDYRAQYDIILMDIQMKFMDGMSAAEEIRKKDSRVVIIFITNAAQYAVRGYQVDALDYIVKPISYFAFSQTLAKAVARLEKKRSFVMLSDKSGMLRLDSASIYYLESEGHRLIVHTADGDYEINATMKAMEEQLRGMNFFRGNKCYLINLEHVEGVRDHCAIVKGQPLQISRPKQGAFMKELTKYWSEVS